MKALAVLLLACAALPAAAEPSQPSPRWGAAEFAFGGYRPSIDREFGGNGPYSTAFGGRRNLFFRADLAKSLLTGYGELDLAQDHPHPPLAHLPLRSAGRAISLAADRAVRPSLARALQLVGEQRLGRHRQGRVALRLRRDERLLALRRRGGPARLHRPGPGARGGPRHRHQPHLPVHRLHEELDQGLRLVAELGP